MTAQSSAKNGIFYKFLPYYRNKLRNLRPQLIMSIIFSALSYPLAAGVFIPTVQAYARRQRLLEKIQAAQNYDASTAEYALYEAAGRDLQMWQSLTITACVIAMLCLMGLFVFTFVTTVKSYRYLYNKSVVDMDYSLPVSHETRFFGDLAAVFTVNILPHLASILLGVILVQFCNVPELNESIGFVYRIVPAAFTGLFACIMEIALTLLMLSFCGRMAEACIYPILVNFAIPVIHSMGLSLVESGIYGNTVYTYLFGISAGTMYPMTASSPLGMIIMTLYSLVTNGFGMGVSDYAPIFRPQYGIPALLVTLACLAGAFFLIKYRRAERVGMPYVYKGMGLVIPGVVIFAVTVPVSCWVSSIVRGQYEDYSYSYTPDVTGIIIGTVIATFIIYVIMDLISGRGFRKFYLTLAKWAGTLGASVLICVVISCSNGFGAAYYVPAPYEVSAVSASYYDSTGEWLDNFEFTADSDDTVLLELVNKVHGEIPKQPMENSSTNLSLSFEYTLKDGRTLSRLYYVSRELFDEMRGQFLIPEAWYQGKCGDIISRVNDGYAIETAEFNESGARVNGIDVNALLEAYKKDSQKVSLEFLQNKEKSKKTTLRIVMSQHIINTETGNVYNSSVCYLVVYDWMDNTIALLKSCGMDFGAEFAPENYGTAFIVRDCGNGVDISGMLAQADGVPYDEYHVREYGGDYVDGDYNVMDAFAKVPTNDPQLKGLVEVCSVNDYHYTSSEYVIILCRADSWRQLVDGYDEYSGNIWLDVPYEYSGIAEQLLADNLVYEPDSGENIA